MFWLSALVRLYAAEIERWSLHAMVYTYTNFADTALDMDALAAYDLWIADYRGKRPTRKHGMWQYMSKGSVPGVKNGVDLSHAYKDYPGIFKRAGLEAVQKEIYEPIAETQHYKWKAIQGVVRRAAKLAWEVNPDAVRVMAVYPLTGCPSAVQFLEMLYNAVVRG